MFITFEGLDGSGKTTILNILADKLKNHYPQLNFVITREPGGKGIVEAEKIRDIILSKESDISPITEALLYTASRRIHLDKVVLPALKNNQLVLCDRYVDSFYAYQGYARNLGIDFVQQLTNLVIDQTMPDLTFFLNLTPEASKKRRQDLRDTNSLNRLDIEKDAFHQKVYDGYLQLIEQEPQRFIVIDASMTTDQVANAVFEALIQNDKFQKHLKQA
ncbi:dTMP kinase [Mycoplasmopsis iners]|uniref:dTMP kinase n=1 Tax=Mycoplasmopsis iners TaxID=76630 RepID=UPI000496915A|nr:dTMP kinase [Mycoplasmopsis iners]